MKLNTIQKLNPVDIKKFWPTSENDWNYLVICDEVVQLKEPFNLFDLLGNDSIKYRPTLKPKKLSTVDEQVIIEHLKRIKAL